MQRYIIVLFPLSHNISTYYNTRHREIDVIYKHNTVLEIQFRSVKCTVVTIIRRNFEQLFIPAQDIKGDYRVLM